MKTQLTLTAALLCAALPVFAADAPKEKTKADAKAVAAAAPDRDSANALAGLDAGNGLKAQLFAAEPLLLSPSNVEVDHLGRIWV